MTSNQCKCRGDIKMSKCFFCCALGVICTLLIFSILISSYYIILPITNFLKSNDIHFIHNDLQLLRNYYSAVGVAISYVASTLGIALGIYYYMNKNSIESQRSLRAKTEKNLEFLLNKYEKINVIVLKITAFSWTDQSHLDMHRRELQEEVLDIQDILGCNERITMLKPKEVAHFHTINSFLDNNHNIMRAPADTLSKNKSAFKDDIAEYLDLLSEVRQFIYNKAKSIA